MKRFVILMVLLCCVLLLGAETIGVPGDYAAIQSAINAAVNGDTVLVSPGTYYENIDYNGKLITVASLFHTTQDTSYISQTIIDGGQNGSVVFFYNNENSLSILTGFTIRNGYTQSFGGGICVYDNSSPSLNNLKVINNTSEYRGGGIYCENHNTTIENVTIMHNSAERGGGLCLIEFNALLINCDIRSNSANSGGGIYIAQTENVYMENVTIAFNTVNFFGGGLYLSHDSSLEMSSTNRCNIYQNNTLNRNCGSDLFSIYPVSIIVDTFTVSNPTEFHASPLENFEFDILHGLQNQISADLYVSPSGDNNNSGTSSEEPLKTIQYACSIIITSENEPHTIYLSEGTYSPSQTGEFFPILLVDNLILEGADQNLVILDAEETANCFNLIHLENVSIMNLTITNGNSECGGGIYCTSYDGSFSNLLFKNLIIKNNYANSFGGGICCFCSNPILDNVTIMNNQSDYYGGGVCCYSAGSPILINVTIANNIATYTGGGFSCFDCAGCPKLVNCILSNNFPQSIVLGEEFDENNEILIAYSNVEGGYEGIENPLNHPVHWLEGNINEDPLFIDAVNDDYNLQVNSPCINTGTAYFEYNGRILIDLQEDEYYGIAPDMGSNEYEGEIVVYYGDIDDNDLVESYDASILLQYLVGLDPLLEDPLPWAEWRKERADVDLNGELMAYDGSLILQYVVGIINELPVRRQYYETELPVEISSDDEYIYFTSNKELYSLSYNIHDLDNLNLGKVEILKEDCLFCTNGNKFALASASPLSGNILRIPYQNNFEGIFGFELQISANGKSEEIEYQLPDNSPRVTCLQSVYPNPFNPQTSVSYYLAEAGKVKIEVYNIKGQKVETLTDEEQNTGDHTLNWQPENISSGIYYIHFNSKDYQRTVKSLLLK